MKRLARFSEALLERNGKNRACHSLNLEEKSSNLGIELRISFLDGKKGEASKIVRQRDERKSHQGCSSPAELPDDEAYYTDEAVAKLHSNCPTCKIVKDSFNACWRASNRLSWKFGEMQTRVEWLWLPQTVHHRIGRRNLAGCSIAQSSIVVAASAASKMKGHMPYVVQSQFIYMIRCSQN
eukprot:2241023-Amphidinium_carterae.1